MRKINAQKKAKKLEKKERWSWEKKMEVKLLLFRISFLEFLTKVFQF
jgi:hypothetical protein